MDIGLDPLNWGWGLVGIVAGLLLVVVAIKILLDGLAGEETDDDRY